MANLTYGTPEYYQEQFSDFLADVDYENPEYADAIIKGFLMCVDDWADYHAKQVVAYDDIKQRVRKALAV